MTCPKVSVIVPNYNHARYLRRRLQSILEQTHQDFELLYLDDASSDDSNAVVAEFTDPRIRAILNKTNTGSPFKQWNKGVREAKGEYIWIAEADDYAAPTLLERLVTMLDAHPSVGLAYCQSWIVDENDKIQFNCIDTTKHLDTQHWTQDFVNKGLDECRRALIYQNTIPNASAILFRRKVYIQSGYAEEGMRLTGDWMTWVRMLLISDVAFVADALNFFRKHSSSVTHKATASGVLALENYAIVDEVLKHVAVTPLEREKISKILIYAWLEAFTSSERVPWQRHLQIYQAARRVDPKALVRLLNLVVRPNWSLRIVMPPFLMRVYWYLDTHVLRRLRRPTPTL